MRATTITLEQVLSWAPCWDVEAVQDLFEEHATNLDGAVTVEQILQAAGTSALPVSDAAWLLIRPEVLSPDQARELALALGNAVAEFTGGPSIPGRYLVRWGMVVAGDPGLDIPESFFGLRLEETPAFSAFSGEGCYHQSEEFWETRQQQNGKLDVLRTAARHLLGEEGGDMGWLASAFSHARRVLGNDQAKAILSAVFASPS